jgi:uncharacterized protein (TIGR02001 family)
MNHTTFRMLPAAITAAALFFSGAQAQETPPDAPKPADAAPAAAPADAPPAGPTLTGHIDLASRYILRGASTTYGPSAPGAGNAGADAPESDKPALQWGLDWTHPSGVYLGWWASTINYSYERLADSWRDRSVADFQHKKSVENDLYGGYNGKIDDDLGYSVGLTGYYYINGGYSNALETKLALTWGPFTAQAQTLLKDVMWGNRGDTYWTLNYSKPVAYDITLTASLGFYTYHKEGQFLGTTDTLTGTHCAAGTSFIVNGCFAGGAPVASGLRHLIVGFTQPIGKTGLTWGLQGLIGGDNRYGVKQNNRLVASLSYGF